MFRYHGDLSPMRWRACVIVNVEFADYRAELLRIDPGDKSWGRSPGRGHEGSGGLARRDANVPRRHLRRTAWQAVDTAGTAHLFDAPPAVSTPRMTVGRCPSKMSGLVGASCGPCCYGLLRGATLLAPSSCGGFSQDGNGDGAPPCQRGCAVVNAFKNLASASDVSRVVRVSSHCSRSDGRYKTRLPSLQ
jgi:hypothetical protein